MGETALHQRSCEACEGKTRALTPDEQLRLRRQIPDWEIVDNHHIARTFKFKGYMDGLSFVNAAAEIAEDERHHPDLHLSWGKVSIEIYTHKVNGLTENDFILAAKIDMLGELPESP